MRFEHLDLNLLVALDELLKTRSVTNAAQYVHISQSAMSSALSRLRAYFGDELLVQSGRSMVLTPRAEELIAPVHEALTLIRSKITNQVEFDPATSERQFSIIASDYSYNVFLADVLRQSSEDAPGIRFDISNPSLQELQIFERGERDLFVMIDAFLPENYPSLPLFDDEPAIVCWDKNPHCSSGIDVDTFSRLGHVAVVYGPERMQGYAEMLYEQMGIDRHIEIYVGSFTHLPQTVVGTRRIATMFRRHAEFFAAFMPIRILPHPLKLAKVQEFAMWHHSRNNDPGSQWLVARLAAQAKKLTAAGAEG